MILDQQPATRRRPGAPTVAADYTPTVAYTDTAIRAAVQRVDGATMQRETGGQRTEGGARVWSHSELEVGDRLVVEGVTWEIIQSRDRRGPLPHFRALAVEVP